MAFISMSSSGNRHFVVTLGNLFPGGRYADAIAAAERALLQNPRLTVALRNLAASLVRLKRKEEAIDAISAAFLKLSHG
jgi:hypothetical protein